MITTPKYYTEMQSPMILKSGDAMAFFLNYETDRLIGTFKVQFLDSTTGEYYAPVLNLVVTELNGYANDKYMYHFAFTVPPVSWGLKNMYYVNMVIFLDNNPIYVSNTCFYTNDTNIENYTALVKFRNTSDIFNYPYSQNANLYNIVRIPIVEVDQQIEIEDEKYKAITDGKTRTYQTNIDRWIKFDMLQCDQKTHEAMYCMLTCDEIYINNKRVYLKTAYKINNDPTKPLVKGEFEVYDADFSQVNNNLIVY